jgi:hypothetical protein
MVAFGEVEQRPGKDIAGDRQERRGLPQPQRGDLYRWDGKIVSVREYTDTQHVAQVLL